MIGAYSIGSYSVSSSPSAGAVISLLDVNGDEIVLDNELGITFTTTGFDSDITSFKIVSGAVTTLGLNLSGTGDNYTVDVPNITSYIVDTVGSPLTSSSNAILYEVTDGVETKQLSGTYSPQAGYAVVETLSAVKTVGSVFENFVGTIVDGSQVYYPTASNTSVSPSGILTTDSTTDIDMKFWDKSDGSWKPFSILIQTAGGAFFGGRSLNRSLTNWIINSGAANQLTVATTGFLLQADGFYLLQENLDKIII